MEKKIVNIFEMRAVGMHHWGAPSLTVGGCYHLEWEPECRHDIGNAMAILEEENNRRAAYLTRADARIVSRIWAQGINYAGLMACKPVTDKHVVEYTLGPQHECTVAFKIFSRDIVWLETLLKAGCCVYTIT